MGHIVQLSPRLLDCCTTLSILSRACTALPLVSYLSTEEYLAGLRWADLTERVLAVHKLITAETQAGVKM